jgi:lysophospholipase L1-like esterase
LFVLAGGVAASGCSSSPTTPTVVDPGAPTLTCPAAPASVQATDSMGAIVNFGNATVTGGSTPLTGPTCTPASGTKFATGTTTVTCSVTDSKARAASCSFSVVVQSAPKLSLTRFLAFGDSITAGEVVAEGFGPPACPGASASSTFAPLALRPLQIDYQLAYPTRLNQLLTTRYPSQVPGPFVDNYGCSGETTSAGLVRLRNVLNTYFQPQVLLLLEGTNDLSSTSTSSTITQGVIDLDNMVAFAKSRNVRVVVGTLPPQNPVAPTGTGASCVARNGGAPFVAQFNTQIRIMASGENIPVADVFAAFGSNVSTLIDCDGLHPTAAGYQTIAQTFFDVITKTLETQPTTTFTPATVSRSRTSSRR